MAGFDERQKKTSLTHLVHSTLGLGLLKPQGEAKSILISPEDESAARLTFYSKKSTGSESSEKMACVADDDDDGGLTSLDTGTRRARGKLPHQPSQDG